jgi:integrase/recombinase XerD
MTVSEAVDGFLFACQYEKNLSPRTLRAYATDLRQFMTSFPCVGKDALISSVGKSELRSYIKALFQRFQEKSVKRKVATLKALFRYLEREDVITISPFQKMDVRIKEPIKVPRTIPIADLRRLFAHLYERVSKNKGFGANIVRDLALIEILFATGARIAEVCSLKRRDLDTEQGWVRVLGKGGRERVIQLCDPNTVAALRSHVNLHTADSSDNFLFLNARGNRLGEQSVRTLLRRYAQTAGITGDIRPHMIRHSVATLLLEQGVDLRHIQLLLGHQSVSTTQIYTHIDPRSQRAVLSSKHPRRLLISPIIAPIAPVDSHI